MLKSGLEVKIYDTPAGGIRASQGTFSSLVSISSLGFGSLHVTFLGPAQLSVVNY